MALTRSFKELVRRRAPATTPSIPARRKTAGRPGTTKAVMAKGDHR